MNPERSPNLIMRLLDSDAGYKFRSSPVTVVAGLVFVLMIGAALLAPVIAPFDPFDKGSIDLMNSLLPPAWNSGGDPAFLLGTDNQGRDLFSTILYGTRTSVFVGAVSVSLAVVAGLFLGLLAGYFGGLVDAIIMRIVDIQMTFPAIMVALLIDGVTRSFLSRDQHDELAVFVIILAMALSIWPQVARTVRASAMVEKSREYVMAAQVIGRGPWLIMARHILPNVMGPVLVIATINLGVAILGEATLSFLGLGIPAGEPSLGTLIRIGNDFIFSGERWMLIYPGLTLALLVLSVNLLGDWLRDVLDPKSR
ncbi:ABC transporter permease [Litoreibacter albidus]|uniref:Peptide/nickel transport system permease protein n=1 Tax=Litoreibacter albidus TaxID=670155 RepID=A0A1H3CR19_9RHOB|nr:ABC transporter permease [Litoreibacter albidus]SDX56575.1 peptide/nickel transport system permease protein [Litoreibacter albidus]